MTYYNAKLITFACELVSSLLARKNNPRARGECYTYAIQPRVHNIMHTAMYGGTGFKFLSGYLICIWLNAHYNRLL